MGGVYLKPRKNSGENNGRYFGQKPTHPRNGKIPPSDKLEEKFGISMSISVISVYFGPFWSISVHFGN